MVEPKIPKIDEKFVKYSFANDIYYEICKDDCVKLDTGEIQEAYNRARLGNCFENRNSKIDAINELPDNAKGEARKDLEKLCDKCCMEYAIDSTIDILGDTESNIRKIFADPPKHPIFRAMRVKNASEFVAKVKAQDNPKVGLWWSAKKESSGIFGEVKPESKERIDLESIVSDPSVINIQATLDSNIGYPEQHEISIKEGKPLFLTRICYREKDGREKCVEINKQVTS